MIIPINNEIEVGGVVDPGIPNKERIILRPRIPTNLQNFVLGVAVMRPDGLLFPAPNYVYYFEDVIVEANSWVILYTGSGKSEVSTFPTSNEKTYSYHWGFAQVIFTRSDLIPLLFRIDAISYPGAQHTYSPYALNFPPWLQTGSEAGKPPY